MSNALDPVRQLAAQQCGAFSAAQALARGPTERQLAWAVGAGEFRRRASGPFVAAGAPSCWEQDLWLSWLGAGDHAAVGGRAAARALGLRQFRKAEVEVLVPVGVSHRQPFGRLRQTRWLPPEHVVTRPGLPPMTSIPRTIFDLAGDPERPATFRVEQWRESHKRWIAKVFNDALRRDDFTVVQMMRVLAALGRRGRAGTTIIRELTTEFGRDYTPTETDLEDLFLDAIRPEGIEEPARQVTVTGPYGWIAKCDYLFRGSIDWEVDGPDHDTPLQKRIDRARDEEMRLAGYEVHRAHWRELVDDPDAVVAEVAASLAAAHGGGSVGKNRRPA